MVRYSAMPGTPQTTDDRKSRAAGWTSDAMPISGSAGIASSRKAMSGTERNSASQSACQNSGGTSKRRPAPSSWDTDGGTANSMPTSVTATTLHSAAPTATPASVLALCRPASTESVKPISAVDTWPNTKGSASLNVLPHSRSNGAFDEREGDMAEQRDCGHAAARVRVAGARILSGRPDRAGRLDESSGKKQAEYLQF